MSYRNLPELHRRQAEQLGPRTALRFRRYGLFHDVSHDEYRADALACAAALVEAGIQPGDRVGMLAENRLEWLLADMGLLAAGAVNVPSHSPLTARQVHFQLDDAGARWLFVSTREQLDKVLSVVKELPKLQGIVVFDRWVGLQQTLSGRLVIQSWDGFLQRGRQLLSKHHEELQSRERRLGPDDLATIMYTSGTTGNPKGVMLTHQNLLSNVAMVQSSEGFSIEDVSLCWLPLSHIYARTVDHYRTLEAGCVLVLAESPETVVRDLAEIQPTHMNSVPRFYEKVLAAVASPDPKELARRLRGIYGPRLKWLCSGGAPLPLPVAEAYRDAGLLLLQGYGLTESSPVISFNRTTRYRLDSVGPPLDGVEVKIADDGEVLSRGPHIMKGYWNNPTATTEAIRDGWLHTGDLGSLEDGFLKITGRKKELMVMSSGKKLVPSYIEGLLIADPCIDQAVVHGEGRNFLTALIVPHWDNLRKELPKPLAGFATEDLARDPQVSALLQQRIQAALTDVAGWEQVKKFVVLPQPFSVAADELTVSLKLRRNVVLTKYREQLEAMYRD
ncbi:MAG: long-chain fatty acid--CoA ligase [Planctomycetia bacterium]|nr:long-chain fatty acid--CoA ligase [Planctomycetia bacterium]